LEHAPERNPIHRRQSLYHRLLQFNTMVTSRDGMGTLTITVTVTWVLMTLNRKELNAVADGARMKKGFSGTGVVNKIGQATQTLLWTMMATQAARKTGIGRREAIP
jgi:hypothetical protein